MSPISPFLKDSGQNNWPNIQIPNSREKCPICGSILQELFGAIGGISGHAFFHSGSLMGYNCLECMRPFSLEEIRLSKEKKIQREMFGKNYWKNVCISFKSPYLYMIIVCFMLLYKSFWAGIVAGVVVVLLMPFLAKGLEIVFTPLGKLFRKILSSEKPPDNPRTP